MALHPRPRPSCFPHALPLVSSPSVFLYASIILSLSLSLLCWSLWLILKGKLSEWVGLKREESAVLSPARSSLAQLKRSAEKKKQHSFSLRLHLSTFFPFHHSWVVWYLTFAVFQQGLGSKRAERTLVSPLSYSVIPPFLFPLPLFFLLFLLLFLPLSSNATSL